MPNATPRRRARGTRAAVRLVAIACLSVVLSVHALAGTQSTTEASVTVEIPHGIISGTLRTPSGNGKGPVALIIAGSGPTDRDGNSPLLPGKNDSYKLLAEALATKGIASLRYDKRGVAGSRVTGLVEKDVRFEQFVDDAAAWITQLKRDHRYSSVIVIGHSEGSLIGMIAARTAGADAFVSIAGPAQGAALALREQLRPQLSPVPAMWDANEAVLASLEAGKTVDVLPPALASVPALAQLYRASVQPYLISWFKYTPSVEIVKLAMPVLVIQGTTDIQVSVADAQALKAAKPSATLTIVPGMNHVLKHVEPDRDRQIASYSDPTLPIAPEVPLAIGVFAGTVPAR